VRGLGRAAALCAALCATVPAAAYERLTTIDGDPASPCLWWGRGGEPRWAPRDTSWLGERGPVWQLSTAHVPSGCAGLEEARVLVREAFAQWSGATRAGEAVPCTGFAPAEGPPTASPSVGRDGVNLVVFRAGGCLDVVPPTDPCLTEGGCGNRYNCWELDGVHGDEVLALTWNTMDLETGEIVDSDIEMHDWDGKPRIGEPVAGPFYFTCTPASWDPSGQRPPACQAYGEAGCLSADVGNTLTHEVGHVVGLDHVASPACAAAAEELRPTMCATARPGTTLWMRTLSADEVEGVCAIYPRGGPTLTCVEPAAGCGCGGGEASWPVILVLSLLLRRGTGPRASRRGGR
jgi:hypothetical protein